MTILMKKNNALQRNIFLFFKKTSWMRLYSYVVKRNNHYYIGLVSQQTDEYMHIKDAWPEAIKIIPSFILPVISGRLTLSPWLYVCTNIPRKKCSSKHKGWAKCEQQYTIIKINHTCLFTIGTPYWSFRIKTSDKIEDHHHKLGKVYLMAKRVNYDDLYNQLISLLLLEITLDVVWTQGMSFPSETTCLHVYTIYTIPTHCRQLIYI